VIGWREGGHLVAVDGIHFEEELYFGRHFRWAAERTMRAGDTTIEGTLKRKKVLKTK
jgi:hypothetical protein